MVKSLNVRHRQALSVILAVGVICAAATLTAYAASPTPATPLSDAPIAAPPPTPATALPSQWVNVLNPFTTDGCSRYPDGIVLDCCKHHDLAYWQGGTSDQRLDADNGLKECIYKTTGSEFKAWYVWKAVRDMGGPLRNTTYRWAYGWKYMRPYGALTADELRQVHAFAPLDATAIPETKATSLPQPLPAIHQNHCVDAAYDYLSAHNIDTQTLDPNSWQTSLNINKMDFVSVETLDHMSRYELQLSRVGQKCADDIYLPDDMKNIRVVRFQVE